MEQSENLATRIADANTQYSIAVSNASKLNLADFQNSIPLIRELSVVNDSEFELTGLQMRF